MMIKGHSCWTAGLLALLGAATFAAGETWCVDDDAPGGYGWGWDQAFTHLQDALAWADMGDIILVAQGVYYPDRDRNNPQGTGDRAASFIVPDGVSICGGYAGLGAPDPSLRDPVAHPTILSGDLAQNDGPGFSGYEDNSSSILQVIGHTWRASIEGFIVRGGNADGQPDYAGAGLFVDDGEDNAVINVIDCVFEGNKALSGAGIYFHRSGGTIRRCQFRDNLAVAYGGALQVRRAEVDILSSTFESNSTTDGPGGALSYETMKGYTDLTDCVFLNNCATYRGGGAVNVAGRADDYCQLSIEDCHFQGNEAEDLVQGLGVGGGLRVMDANIDLIGCTFVDNHSSATGGGAYVGTDDRADITGCRFLSNTATVGGGGLVAGGNEGCMISNCEFINNFTAGNAGGLSCGGLPMAPERIVNCLFYGNTAWTLGGGIWTRTDLNLIANCIFWNNEDAQGMGDTSQIYLEQTDHQHFEMRYSIVQGWAGSLPGVSISGLEPRLADPDGPDDTLGTIDDDVSLGAGSPAIDAGDNSPMVLPADLAGNIRRVDDPDAADTGLGAPPLVDIGPYEAASEPYLECPGDLDGDSSVNQTDLGIVLAAYELTDEGDVDGDGDTDQSDLGLLLAHYGTDCT